MTRLLLVDDDIEVLKTLGNAFITLMRGYQLFTAVTANQGLSLIKYAHPDVIIMDVRLGPESGMDLLEDYPRHIENYEPRIIVITAYDDEKVKKRAEELKVDAFLLKPFKPEELVCAVAEAIDKTLASQRASLQLLIAGLKKKISSTEEAGKDLEKPKA